MKKEEITQLFMQGIDCSQVVTGEFAEELQIDQGMLRKMAACFGGGMQCGETCGAITGAFMVLGLKYGHCVEGDAIQKAILSKKMTQFNQMFSEKYPSCICKELLGHDISKEGEMQKVLEKGLLFDFCPALVEDVIHLLKQV